MLTFNISTVKLIERQESACDSDMLKSNQHTRTKFSAFSYFNIHTKTLLAFAYFNDEITCNFNSPTQCFNF